MIAIEDGVHCVVNAPLEKYKAPMFISKEGVYTFNGVTKTIIAEGDYSSFVDAFYYGNSVYYTKNPIGLMKINLETNQEELFTNLCSTWYG